MISDGKVGISEFTSYGVHSPIAYFNVEETVSLKVEYYENMGKYKVYIGGVLVLESGLLYSSESRGLAPAFVRFSSEELAGVMFIDNLSLGRFGKVYVKPSSANPENGAETLTFSYSSGASYPSGIKYHMSSEAPAPTVEELTKDGRAEKALVFKTFADASGMDELFFDPTAKLSGFSSYAVELDMMIDHASGGTAFFQLHLRKETVSQIEITFGYSDGQLVIYQKDYVSGKTGEKIAVASLGQWFNFRVEAYTVDERPIIKVYVDGELCFVSDTVYQKYNGATTFDSLAIKALKGPSATLFIDNFTFAESSAEYDGAAVDYLR